MIYFHPNYSWEIITLMVSIIGFTSCLLARVLNRFVKPLTLNLFAGFFLIILLGGFLFPLKSLFKKEEYQPQAVFSSKLTSFRDAFLFEEMSRIICSSENISAGLFKKYDAIDIADIAPSITSYFSDSDVLFWGYSFKPIRFYRKGATLYVIGKHDTYDVVNLVVLKKGFLTGVTSLYCEFE